FRPPWMRRDGAALVPEPKSALSTIRQLTPCRLRSRKSPAPLTPAPRVTTSTPSSASFERRRSMSAAASVISDSRSSGTGRGGGEAGVRRSAARRVVGGGELRDARPERRHCLRDIAEQPIALLVVTAADGIGPAGPGQACEIARIALMVGEDA